MNQLIFYGLKVTFYSSDILLERIIDCVKNKKRLLITYAGFHTLNMIYENPKLLGLFDDFDVIHPDGTGVFLASVFTGKKNMFTSKFSGSDFYPSLISAAIEKRLSLFFLGDKKSTLDKIPSRHKTLKIAGMISGYNFNSGEVISEVNEHKPDVLIVGLGSPMQEEWISENKDALNTFVIMAVGDGIKVFAGTKVRGPAFLRKIGFEWLTRLLSEPERLWKRYILGIPKFLYRLIKTSFANDNRRISK